MGCDNRYDDPEPDYNAPFREKARKHLIAFFDDGDKTDLFLAHEVCRSAPYVRLLDELRRVKGEGREKRGFDYKVSYNVIPEKGITAKDIVEPFQDSRRIIPTRTSSWINEGIKHELDMKGEKMILIGGNILQRYSALSEKKGRVCRSPNSEERIENPIKWLLRSMHDGARYVRGTEYRSSSASFLDTAHGRKFDLELIASRAAYTENPFTWELRVSYDGYINGFPGLLVGERQLMNDLVKAGDYIIGNRLLPFKVT
jgi:hypothetical protein